jgi:hypothetical protein
LGHRPRLIAPLLDSAILRIRNKFERIYAVEIVFQLNNQGLIGKRKPSRVEVLRHAPLDVIPLIAIGSACVRSLCLTPRLVSLQDRVASGR